MGLGLLLQIALVGLLAWGLIKLVPMPGELQKVIIVAAVIIAVLLALPLISQLIAAVGAL